MADMADEGEDESISNFHILILFYFSLTLPRVAGPLLSLST